MLANGSTVWVNGEDSFAGVLGVPSAYQGIVGMTVGSLMSVVDGNFNPLYDRDVGVNLSQTYEQFSIMWPY